MGLGAGRVVSSLGGNCRSQNVGGHVLQRRRSRALRCSGCSPPPAQTSPRSHAYFGIPRTARGAPWTAATSGVNEAKLPRSDAVEGVERELASGSSRKRSSVGLIVALQTMALISGPQGCARATDRGRTTSFAVRPNMNEVSFQFHVLFTWNGDHGVVGALGFWPLVGRSLLRIRALD